MKHKEIKLTVAAAAAMLMASGAFAQSSVTLYGSVDASITYLNSAAPSVGATTGGHSIVKMTDGVWAGDRFGLKGSEDLGGGTKAIFQLEQGFNASNGTAGVAGDAFNRQSWVGMSNATFGTFTAGRQYSSYYDLLSAYGPTPWLTGAFGAHPGDIDGLDTTLRINNALKYTSPVYAGFKFSGMYALGGQAGAFGLGQSWSVAGQYATGPVGLGVGYLRLNNANGAGGTWSASSTALKDPSSPEASVTAITKPYAGARAQNRFAVTGNYQFTSQWDVSAQYSNTQYLPGTANAFHNTQIWNTVGASVHFHPATAWDFAAGYAYVAATQANGVSNAATYQQVNLTQLYNVSKRTRFYVLEAYQRAHGDVFSSTTPGGVKATAQIGDQGTAASSPSQVGVVAGIYHAF